MKTSLEIDFKHFITKKHYCANIEINFLERELDVRNVVSKMVPLVHISPVGIIKKKDFMFTDVCRGTYKTSRLLINKHLSIVPPKWN